jgi:hypothetical protein
MEKRILDSEETIGKILKMAYIEAVDLLHFLFHIPRVGGALNRGQKSSFWPRQERR